MDLDTVDCLECLAETGASKPFKTLTSHLKKHVLSVADYRAKYGDDVAIGWSVTKAPPLPPKPKAAEALVGEIVDAIHISAVDPNIVVTTSLDDAERQFFTERYTYLLRAAEDDRALESQIRDIVMGEITLMRYQKELGRITASLGTVGTGLKRLGDAKALQTLIKEMREQNLRDIKSLNLTREQKQAQRKSVDTTPARLMSRYAQIIAALSPEQLSRQREDELEAATRFQVNLRKLLILIPSDAIAGDFEEEEEDE